MSIKMSNLPQEGRDRQGRQVKGPEGLPSVRMVEGEGFADSSRQL